MTERQWTDAAITHEVNRIYKNINGTPQKMVRLEEAQKALANVVQDMREDHERDMASVMSELQGLRAEIKGKKWSRGQLMMAASVVAAFMGSCAAVVSVIFG